MTRVAEKAANMDGAVELKFESVPILCISTPRMYANKDYVCMICRPLHGRDRVDRFEWHRIKLTFSGKERRAKKAAKTRANANLKHETGELESITYRW